MIYLSEYVSPLGGILLAADEIGMRGLWFDGQKYFARGLPDERTERRTLTAARSVEKIRMICYNGYGKDKSGSGKYGTGIRFPGMTPGKTRRSLPVF